MDRISQLDVEGQRRRIMDLLKAMEHRIGELERLSGLCVKNPKRWFYRFTDRYGDFEAANTAIMHFFEEYPEQATRTRLNERAELLAQRALAFFLQTSMRFLLVMSRQRDLPLGIKPQFVGLRTKMIDLQVDLSGDPESMAANQKPLEHVVQMRSALDRLIDRSTDLVEFK